MILAVLVSMDAGTVFAVSNTVKWSRQKVEMERVFNFRDLGGYQTASGRKIRRGILFRSGELSYATVGDLKTMSRKLRIRKVIDLRYNADRKYCPDKAVPGATTVHIPIKQERKKAEQKAINRNRRFTELSDSVGTAEFYGTFAGSRRKVVRKNTTNLINSKASRNAYRIYFRSLLNNPNRKPILVHCIAGKDRTGIAAFMTLLALGVDEKTAIRDYSMTNSVYTAYHAGAYGKYSAGVSESDLKFEGLSQISLAT
jgi:protein-tyrosine phosphatase